MQAAFASTVAPFGGFLASAIKRAYKVGLLSSMHGEILAGFSIGAAKDRAASEHFHFFCW